jgi:tellurite resistance protein
MFLSLLSSDQREAFATVARRIIHADGRLDAEESWYLNLLEKEMGVATWHTRPTSHETFAESLSVFDNRFSRNILLLEAVAVALADGEIDPTEMEVLVDITNHFHIDEQKIERFRVFARRILDLMDEGQELIASR